MHLACQCKKNHREEKSEAPVAMKEMAEEVLAMGAVEMAMAALATEVEEMAVQTVGTKASVMVEGTKAVASWVTELAAAGAMASELAVAIAAVSAVEVA